MENKIWRKSTHLLSRLLLLAAVALAPTTKSMANAEGDDVIAGAGAHFAYVIFDMLKKELEEKSNRRIALFGKNSTLGVGCKAGVKMAKQNVPGRETFGFVCCPLDQEEIDKEGLIVYPLALEPVMILVNESNPIDNLTSQQVRDIFQGKVTNWREVGGNNQPIVVVTRLHCKERPGHWKTILPSDKEFRQDRINVKSADEMVSQINKFPGAFGHTGSTWEFDIEDQVKIVRVDGLLPTAKNLAAKKYPFYRPLSAITNRQPSPDVLAIIKNVQEGDSFKEITKRYQLVPIQAIP